MSTTTTAPIVVTLPVPVPVPLPPPPPPPAALTVAPKPTATAAAPPATATAAAAAATAPPPAPAADEKIKAAERASTARDWPLATRLWSALMTERPGDSGVMVQRAFVLEQTGQLPEAARLLLDAERIIKTQPNGRVAGVLYSLARVESKLDRKEQALATIDETIRIAPDYRKAYTLRDSIRHELRALGKPTTVNPQLRPQTTMPPPAAPPSQLPSQQRKPAISNSTAALPPPPPPLPSLPPRRVRSRTRSRSRSRSRSPPRHRRRSSRSRSRSRSLSRSRDRSSRYRSRTRSRSRSRRSHSRRRHQQQSSSRPLSPPPTAAVSSSSSSSAAAAGADRYRNISVTELAKTALSRVDGGDFKSGRDIYTEINRRNHPNIQSRDALSLAFCLEKLGEFETAMTHIDHALRILPTEKGSAGFGDSNIRRARLAQARIFLKLGKTERTFEILKEILDVTPDFVPALKLRSYAHDRIGNAKAKAIELDEIKRIREAGGGVSWKEKHAKAATTGGATGSGSSAAAAAAVATSSGSGRASMSDGQPKPNPPLPTRTVSTAAAGSDAKAVAVAPASNSAAAVFLSALQSKLPEPTLIPFVPAPVPVAAPVFAPVPTAVAAAAPAIAAVPIVPSPVRAPPASVGVRTASVQSAVPTAAAAAVVSSSGASDLPPLSVWDVLTTANWFGSLGTAFRPYEQTIIENRVDGNILYGDVLAGGATIEQTLTDLQITNSVHRKVIKAALLKLLPATAAARV